jgi:hypothetical protein
MGSLPASGECYVAATGTFEMPYNAVAEITDYVASIARIYVVLPSPQITTAIDRKQVSP